MHPVEADSAPSGLAGEYLNHRPSLLRLLTARTRDAAEAEDILQDLWFRIQDFAGPIANPKAYLHRSALNLANDRGRARRQNIRREADWVDATTIHSAAGEALDDSPSTESVLDGQRELARIVTALDEMPPGAARVFRRHKLDGQSHAEVAAEFGISKSAVEKHMAVALRHLLRALGREAGSGR